MPARARICPLTSILVPALTGLVSFAPCAALAGEAAAFSARAPTALIAFEAPSEDDMSAAQAAYQEGEKAYRLGHFEEAAGHFEEAYELSGLPDILYNIGLSHLRWYDIDPSVSHLRKAKVVVRNYQIEVEKNPELGDAAEAETLIEQIDDKIEAHEQAGAQQPNPVGPEAPEPGADPGKKLRLAGTVSLGLGGAIVVGGTVSAVLMGVSGQKFQEELQAEYNTRDANNCQTNDPREDCIDTDANIEVLRANGRRANVLAVGLGVSLGGLGFIGLVAGTVLFIQGNKRTKAWEERQLGVVPTFGGGVSGLSLSGRF